MKLLSTQVSRIWILALMVFLAGSVLPVAAEEAVNDEILSLEEMESLWGGAEKPCSKCDTTRKKCPAGQPGTPDCVCFVAKVPFIGKIKKCALGCPSGTGYLDCVDSDKKTDKCDPVKTTKKYCKNHSWDWKGPGNAPSCPANFNCATKPGAGNPSTSDGYRASCG